MQVFAPAKLNLSLKILGRRPDGFHDIETFIAPISLCDELKIDKNKAAEGVEFRCDDSSVPTGDENLVVRAGLGGGSSDAASTLLAMNKLFETNLPREALAELGETIGSDVPFFIFESAAMCRGRGELVTPEKLKEAMSILLLKPEFGVATAWAYQRWQDSREIPGISYPLQEFNGHRFANNLERPVFEKFVFLAQMKTWLRNQPEVGVALMSGSGSTVFAVMRPNVDLDLVAKRAKDELDPRLWTCAAQTQQGAALSAP